MTMDRIPHDVETLVRDAAQAAPGYGGDYTDIPRIARRQRQRQTATVFTAVAAVLAVVGAGVAVNRGPDRSAPVNPPAATTAPPAPAGAQRLLLNGADGSYRTFDNGTETYTVLRPDTQVGEFTVDGGWRLGTHPVTGADRWDRVVGRADGSIVAIGPKGSSTFLVVTGPAGDVVLSRDLSGAGTGVSLVAADQEHAYLWRPDGLVEHTLNAGGERLLIAKEQLDVTGFDDGQIVTADVQNGRLALVRKASPCTVELYDLDRPAEAGLHDLTDDATCRKVTGVRLSPDGAQVAMAWWFTDPDSSPQIDVMTSDGTDVPAISASVDVEPFPDEEPIVAMSWVDRTTIRGIFLRPAAGRAGMTPFTATA
jgi:hypothetical protein